MTGRALTDAEVGELRRRSEEVIAAADQLAEQLRENDYQGADEALGVCRNHLSRIRFLIELWRDTPNESVARWRRVRGDAA